MGALLKFLPTALPSVSKKRALQISVWLDDSKDVGTVGCLGKKVIFSPTLVYLLIMCVYVGIELENKATSIKLFQTNVG